MNFLKKQTSVNSDHIAAIGYCFGGGVVLHMARLGIEGVDGVVSFHGSLSTQMPAKTGTVKAKILVCHGAADPFIAPEQIEEFKKEMQSAEADLKFIAYPEAVHSFTNPDADTFAEKFAEKFGLPLAYNAKADRQSWADMQEFFKTVFDAR